MKAFYVRTEGYDWDEVDGEVLFANSAIEARRRGADEWNDGELGGMRVSRKPQWDKYHSKGIPAREMIRDGWIFECHGCGERLDEDNLDDIRMPVEGVVGIYEWGGVYCCWSCKAEHEAAEAAKQAYGKVYLEMLRGIVRERFGADVQFVERFGLYGDGVYIEKVDGHFLVRSASVGFSFPDMKYGAATLSLDESYPSYRRIGPRKLGYACTHGDLEAFEAYCEATRNVEK